MKYQNNKKSIEMNREIKRKIPFGNVVENKYYYQQTEWGFISEN